jgi:Zn-dependent protease with chaperone function
MAKLFGPGGPPSGSICDPQPSGEGLVLVVEGEDPQTMPYAGMSHRVGGYENAWTLVTSTELPDIELWLLDAEVVRLAGPAGDVPEAARHVFAGMLGTRTELSKKASVKRGIAFAAFALVVFWMVSGGFTGLIVSLIPQGVESSLGETLADAQVVDAVVCSDPVLVGAVEEILVRLVEAMDDTGYTFRVRVIRSDDINAFALPGGEIFFHTALLEKAESVDEVAAVMGHEVQHVLLQHGLRGMVRSAGISLGVGLIFGDASETVAMLATYAGGLTDLKFGRDQERDSDSEGVALMARAGFDPHGAVRFFGMLAEETGDDGGAAQRVMAIASTHPASSERTERLRGLATTTARTTKTTMGVDWERIRGHCSAAPATPKEDVDGD